MDTIATSLHDQIQKLSPRQVEILDLLAEGKDYKRVSTILSISSRSVKDHVRKMCQKTGAENRTQLIVIYAKWQMLMELDRKD